jgi:Leucine-rich repeat (LRR) protein
MRYESAKILLKEVLKCEYTDSLLHTYEERDSINNNIIMFQKETIVKLSKKGENYKENKKTKNTNHRWIHIGWGCNSLGGYIGNIMKHYIKQRLRESLLNEELSDEDKIINLLKSGDESNIELAYALGEGQGINVDELVESIYGHLFVLKFNSGTIKDKLISLINFKVLNLSFNNLTTLPEGVNDLTNLETLTLRGNQLITLKGIKNLTNLKYLDLYNNKLTSLEGIEYLTNLVWLRLSNNQLISLKGIKNLTNLKWLGLSNNKLTTLPEGIENLTNLKELYLSDNPISDEEIERIKELLPNTKISISTWGG